MENKLKNIQTFEQHSNENLEKSDVIDDKISKLIKRKLDGDTLSENEFIQLHKWMMKNDKEYSDLVDKELNKDLKKYIKK